MRDGTRDQLRLWVHILIVVAAVRLLELLAGCGSRPPSVKPPEPRPPAVIEVVPDPLPCVLPPLPDPLGPLGATPMEAGTWALLDVAGHRAHELELAKGVHTPRDRWDAMARYILALQAIAIDAKRCHPEAAP